MNVHYIVLLLAYLQNFKKNQTFLQEQLMNQQYLPANYLSFMNIIRLKIDDLCIFFYNFNI